MLQRGEAGTPLRCWPLTGAGLRLLATVFASLGFIVVAASTGGVVVLVLVPVGFMAGGLLCCVLMVRGWGATIGKQIFGLRVVRLWSDGALPPS
ncbi:RDD family protein [Streptomyces mirabilis]